MTPKEKAEELFNAMCVSIGSNCEHSSYCDKKECQTDSGVFCHVDKATAKKCAEIVVKNIIEEVKRVSDAEMLIISIIYWEKVIQEIEEL